MKLQVSHRICAEVSSKSIFRREEKRDTRDIEDAKEILQNPTDTFA